MSYHSYRVNNAPSTEDPVGEGHTPPTNTAKYTQGGDSNDEEDVDITLNKATPSSSTGSTRPATLSTKSSP